MSFWLSFRTLFSSLLHALGFAQRQATLILLGLDNAGKTTLQYKLKTGQLQQFLPTTRAKEETLNIEGMTIKAWDLGGHQAARQLWRKYADIADGIIFMVDANDPDRLAEAAEELHGLLRADELADIPIAIFANKCEMKSSLSVVELESGLKLREVTHARIQLFRVSVIAGEGYVDGFRWIASVV